MSFARKLVSTVIPLILVLGLCLVGCGPKAVDTSKLGLIEEGKLIIGSDCDYPPFVYMEGKNPAGFEVELMQAIADDLGLELVYLPPQNFDTLLTSVAGGGQMDLAVSSLTINDERKELVNFCRPYFNSNQAVVTRANSPYTKVEDLAGLSIGAQSGTTGEAWAIENLPTATVKSYNQTSEGLAALRAGEIEALFFDEPVATEQVSTNFTDCQIIQVIPTGEQYGFAVSKDNPALEQAINDSLQRLINNGTYAQIFSKYFDFDPTIK